MTNKNAEKNVFVSEGSTIVDLVLITLGNQQPIVIIKGINSYGPREVFILTNQAIVKSQDEL